MGFQDRSYGRQGGDGGGFGGGDFRANALRILNASLPLGTYLNIRVRLHISFLFVLAWRLSEDGGIFDNLRFTALLFLSVLLHEFGHCLACRSVGGRADDILMWPLGGLAMCEPPPRPWAEFITVIWGPLVNVLIAALCFSLLAVMFGGDRPVGLVPLNMFKYWPSGPLAQILTELFVLNYALLLFNLLLVFYPFDGGRLVQIGLWTMIGRIRSLRVATTIGMVGAIGVAIFGLTVHSLMLVLIAAFGFYACYQQRRHLMAYGAEDIAYEQACLAQERSEKKVSPIASMRAAKAERKRQREAERAQKFDEEIDRILAKIHEHGIGSLTSKEKRTLAQRSDEQRRA
jgi:Zn-dependent protease